MGGILIVEDDENLGRLLERKLAEKGFRVDRTCSGEEARELIRSRGYDVVLLDIRLKDTDGFEILKEFAGDTLTKFIVITGYGDLRTAVEAMRAGATDFIQKPFSFDILEVSIDRALKEKRLEEENRALRSILLEKDQEVLLETRSPAFREVLETAKKVAGSDINVLIRGETGTGKEVLARYIHRLSPRSEGPFIVVDCSAIPEHLFESEVFGHEKGAYTGATQKKLGLVELADGGTLFLDEIGDVPLHVQSKLLRFVETRRFRRVGGLKEISVDVRIISATNRDLSGMVSRGEFRSDLLFRLNVVEINIPPLRERKEDIPLLVDHFLSRYGKKIRKETLKALTDYPWPGNVRELKNAIERAVLLSRGEYVDENLCLPKDGSLECPEDLFSKMPSLEDLELMYVDYLYRRLGSVSKVAEVLRCSRRTVFRKLKKLRERNGNPEEGPLSGPAPDVD
ncbi:MAG: sigma-54 dependent transcriptional regulator [Aquificota bacterium]|nr:sigma-54 dependent transcriptional regulator [Aquificota bacterium]